MWNKETYGYKLVFSVLHMHKIIVILTQLSVSEGGSIVCLQSKKETNTNTAG